MDGKHAGDMPRTRHLLHLFTFDNEFHVIEAEHLDQPRGNIKKVKNLPLIESSFMKYHKLATEFRKHDLRECHICAMVFGCVWGHASEVEPRKLEVPRDIYE